MKLQTFPAAVFVAATLLSFGPARGADDDHGHDHGDAASTAGDPASPRFAIVSEAFELVGVLNGKQITLYLDRFADNAPVPDAQIQLDIGGAKLKAAKHGDAEYEVVLAELPKPGVLAITATVTVGSKIDALTGVLDMHEAAHTERSEHTHSWREYAGWVIGGIAALALLLVAGRRLMASRRARVGGAA